MNKFNLTDQTFERLTVMRQAGKNRQGNLVWECQCSCGNIKLVTGINLRSKRIMSCGCLKKELFIKRVTTHGMSYTTTYISWQAMIQRCNNPKHKHYPNYGGRGIKVCKEWLKFERFFKDMGKRPKGLTIERKNNKLGYFKNNCTYATHTIQSRNQGISKNNKTGIKGVNWSKSRNRYCATITANYVAYFLGRFKTLEQATEARRQAELKYW